MASLESLRSQGWHLSSDGFNKLCENNSSRDLKFLTRKALDVDLRDIGAPIIVTELSKDVFGPVVLQILKVRNVSASKAKPKSQTAPRMLKLSLTDGHANCQGIEMKQIPALSLDHTVPGTKILVEGANISSGCLMLDLNNCKVLGGNVPALVDKWEVAKLMPSHIRVNEHGPPAWVNFGKKIEGSKNLNKEGFKSLETKNKENTKEDAEFLNQRQGAISEAAQGAVKKVFGGGVKAPTTFSSNEQNTNQNNTNRASNLKPMRNKGRDRTELEQIEKPSQRVSLFDFLEDKLPASEAQSKTNNNLQLHNHDYKSKSFDNFAEPVRENYSRNKPQNKFNNERRDFESNSRNGSGNRFQNDRNKYSNDRKDFESKPGSENRYQSDRNKFTNDRRDFEHKPGFENTYQNDRNKFTNDRKDFEHKSGFENKFQNDKNKFSTDRKDFEYKPSFENKYQNDRNKFPIDRKNYENKQSSENSYPANRNNFSYDRKDFESKPGPENRFQNRNTERKDNESRQENRYQNDRTQNKFNSDRKEFDGWQNSMGYQTDKPPRFQKQKNDHTSKYPGNQNEPRQEKSSKVRTNARETRTKPDTNDFINKLATEINNISLYNSKYENEKLHKPNNIETSEENTWKWKSGDRCMAKYWEDNKYYNAVVTGITDRTCMVEFLEYGNFEEVLYADCIPVTSEKEDLQLNQQLTDNQEFSGNLEFKREKHRPFVRNQSKSVQGNRNYES